MTSSTSPALALDKLTFGYPGCQPFLRNLDLTLPAGSRCLLLGANGAGKSTLLQVLAGKFMVAPESIRILGRSPFEDLQLTCTGELSYLGTQWRRDVAFCGNDVALQADIAAGDMIFGIDGVDAARRQQLIDLLDIDLAWRLNRVSDGQRRRVQICLGLLKPYQVLLLDEITVDMDVVGRLDLLDFFRLESEQRGATIIYCTHIFDGLETWITHIAHVARGKMVRGGRVDDVLPELGQQKLLHLVETWLRDEARQAVGEEEEDKVELKKDNPYFSSRHMAFYR